MSTQALLGFRPMGSEEGYFIGEAILIVAASTFVAAFLKGVNSALETRGKELGMKTTNWLADRLEGLFRKRKVTEADEEELKKQIHDLSESAATLGSKTLA